MRIFTLLAFMFGALNMSIVSAEIQAVYKPDIQKGSRWAYEKLNLRDNTVAEVIEYSVSKVSNDQISGKITILEGDFDREGRSTTVNYDREWNPLNSANRRSKQRTSYQFPLQAGKEWDTRYIWVENQRTRQNRQEEIKVIGWETITVPAGSFRALKIESSGRYTLVGGGGRPGGCQGRVSQIHWYAPEVARWVQSDYEDTTCRGVPNNRWRMQLTDYSLGGTQVIQARANSAGKDDLPRLLAALPTAAESPQRFLYAIGIENYSDKTIPAVPYAKRSSALTVQAMQKTLGIPTENTVFIQDQDATGTWIIGQLKNLLNRLEPDDTLYFYYTGHGVPGLNDGEMYLLPRDGVAGSYEDKNFSINRIYGQMQSSKVGRIVAFVDACFSGQADSDRYVFKGVAPAARVSRVAQKPMSVKDNRMTVLTAGKDNQFANAFEARQHRMFSYFLTRALIEGRRDIKDLANYVSTSVARESKKKGVNFSQEPQLYGRASGKL